MDDDNLLNDANSWYSSEQVNEIKRFASHRDDCLSRKGAHYDWRHCDCGYGKVSAYAGRSWRQIWADNPDDTESFLSEIMGRTA